MVVVSVQEEYIEQITSFLGEENLILVFKTRHIFTNFPPSPASFTTMFTWAFGGPSIKKYIKFLPLKSVHGIVYERIVWKQMIIIIIILVCTNIMIMHLNFKQVPESNHSPSLLFTHGVNHMEKTILSWFFLKSNYNLFLSRSVSASIHTKFLFPRIWVKDLWRDEEVVKGESKRESVFKHSFGSDIWQAFCRQDLFS